MLPLSQPSQSFEELLTTLPSAVKIEELDFSYQQQPTATFDAELAHLHKQVGHQDKKFYKLASFLNEHLKAGNETLKAFEKHTQGNCATLLKQQMQIATAVEKNTFTL